MKKILSTALVVLILFGSVAGLMPVKVEAAYASVSGTPATSLDADAIREIVNAAYVDYKDDTAGLAIVGGKIDNAEERLAYESSKGYIVSFTSGDYTVSVNKYTGMVYYENDKTGQILTSNPAVLSGVQSAQQKLMNQIALQYSLDTGAEVANNGILLSSRDAAERGQISVGFISGGIRVNYTIGDTTTRYDVPAQIMEEDFIEFILNPMIANYESLIEAHLLPAAADAGITITEQDYKFDSREFWGQYNDPVVDSFGNFNFPALTGYLDGLTRLVDEVFNPLTQSGNPARVALRTANAALATLATSYILVDPANEAAYGEGGYSVAIKEKMNFYVENPDSMQAIYYCTKTIEDGGAAALENLQKNLAIYAGYNSALLLEHEGKCLYEAPIIENPVFKCSLEYTINADDGSLSVRLPVNSISFDEAVYNLDSISPLQYFGAGNLTGEGYVFIPDGSGSVINYDDFYTRENKQSVSIKMQVYGDDFAYATPSAKHKEQVTMPVYGISTVNSEADLHSTSVSDLKQQGFFAILEEGASLASISVEFGTTETKRAAVYTSYAPYPSDKYVSNSTIGGASSDYTIVSDSKYTGSYVTRYVLLGDDCDYPATYVGMASYYRDYLKSRGELTALEEVSREIPLYIEALGSMSVLEKILTFPVTVSKSLTSFEDIITMYNELSDVTSKFESKAQEYRDKAEASEDNNTLREKYLARAAEYDELVRDMKSISNINFKLTGFANGGMYYTYPTKVKWERACGGRRDFRDLLEVADEKNFGVFPEFDFTYVTNTAWNDGISKGKDLSRMVDNRYASKQVYNSVLGIYESFYAMVVSTDALDDLYDGFSKSYGKYDHNKVSVGTLGSDLNSNLDRDNAINRHDSSMNVVALLDRIANTDGYEVMTSVGNSYALAYADHILDISTDSSHLIYSSYAVPFIGMVLHGYVNYAGAPLNYAGSPDYEVLRAIENGASLYYILCYENTEFMKEDQVLNDYYGIDYHNWYDDLVRTYNVLNDAIGKYQDYEIVDHRTILAERVIDKAEADANYDLLKIEFIANVVSEIENAIDAKFNEMQNNSVAFGNVIKLVVDIDALVVEAAERINLDVATLEADGFKASLESAVGAYTEIHNATSDDYKVEISSAGDYESAYDFVTDSAADDQDYDYTDYTADNDRVVVVTYQHPETGDTVSFILNYNVYEVKVILDGVTYPTIGKYGFVKIEG